VLCKTAEIAAGLGTIPAGRLANYVREAIGGLVSAVTSFGILGPAILGVSLLETSGYRFGVSQDWLPATQEPADRADLIIPEMRIEGIEAVTDVDSIARPTLDVLWQRFDVERCDAYDQNGKWIG